MSDPINPFTGKPISSAAFPSRSFEAPPPPAPSRPAPSPPDVINGEIYRAVGKYARGAVLYAFERIGGPDGLANWAVENPDDFYTKLFPKIITRETEVQHTRSVDELSTLLDADYEVEEAEIVEDRYGANG